MGLFLYLSFGFSVLVFNGVFIYMTFRHHRRLELEKASVSPDKPS